MNQWWIRLKANDAEDSKEPPRNRAFPVTQRRIARRIPCLSSGSKVAKWADDHGIAIIKGICGLWKVGLVNRAPGRLQ